MTKPDDIDQDAWEKSIEVDCGFFTGHRGLYVEDIARAIMSAKAEERERAVHVVESHKVRCDLNTCHFASPSHECKYSDGFSEWRYDADIAAAIRNRH